MLIATVAALLYVPSGNACSSSSCVSPALLIVFLMKVNLTVVTWNLSGNKHGRENQKCAVWEEKDTGKTKTLVVC